MKRIGSALALSAVFLPEIGAAIDFGIQPRLEGGVMYYQYEQDATITIDQSDRGRVSSQSGLKIEDTLPFIGGGITIFADRFFVDFSAQYADNGSDTTSTESSLSVTEQQGANFANQQTKISNNWNTDFDRTDFAVSVGYSVTDHWAVYAGYKRAETDFESKRSGSLNRQTCGSPSVTIDDVNSGVNGCSFADPINFTEDNKLNFESDGPYIGTTFGWDIDKGFMQGVLRGNIAIAFLDATVEETRTNVNRTNGTQLRPNTIDSFDGDTVGVSLGLGWYGFTAIDRLSYLIAADGYQYDYDGKGNQDFTEQVIRLRLGLAYAFDF